MRTFGIWAFGLLACGTFGGLIGSLIESGYSDDTIPGFLIGVFAFSCIRLWLGQKRDDHRATQRAGPAVVMRIMKLKLNRYEVRRLRQLRREYGSALTWAGFWLARPVVWIAEAIDEWPLLGAVFWFACAAAIGYVMFYWFPAHDAELKAFLHHWLD
jgi:hypothetical protein